jgi:hypothetical protein
MAKHLSEFRNFPLFFYGQNYMLGVQAWLAVPFFWIGGPTVAMLRTPIMLVNMAVALAFIWFFWRQGLRPRYAFIAALPIVALTPAKAMDFAAIYGVGIEPFGYVLLLWVLRHRPIAFGAVLGFGTLHREFTFLAVPALAIAVWRDPVYRSVSSLALRVAGFAAVWLLVDIVKRNVNVLGPPGGTYIAGSVALGPKTVASWVSFDWPGYSSRVWQMVSWGLPDMFGLRRYGVDAYNIPGNLHVGSTIAGAAFVAALAIALARVLSTRHPAVTLSREWRQLTIYLAALGVLNVLIYGLNGGILVHVPPVLRYSLLAPLFPVAVLAAFYRREPATPWKIGVAAAMIVWAGTCVIDNARLVQHLARNPPPKPHRIMADYLVANGIRYASQ